MKIINKYVNIKYIKFYNFQLRIPIYVYELKSK